MSFITPTLVHHVAVLANLPLTSKQEETLTPKLSSVLEYTTKIQAAQTDGVEETSQVTGLENIWREDVVDTTRTFSQEEALSQATHTYKGYFVVRQLIGE